MPKSSRDDSSAKTRLNLSLRAGGRCSHPSCRAATSGPRVDPQLHVSVGVAAHIRAASQGGPRYDPQMSAEERRGIGNGIWLCQNHARLIDADADHYPVPLLEKWKQDAEDAARCSLGVPAGSISVRNGHRVSMSTADVFTARYARKGHGQDGMMGLAICNVTIVNTGSSSVTPSEIMLQVSHREGSVVEQRLFCNSV